MKRKNIMFAVAGMAMSTAVFAQSNVTLGGQIKMGLDHVTVNGGSGADPSVTRMSSNTSYWFLDGKEDLGSGKQAYYHLEWDFSADTGAPGPGRMFFVGLGDKDLGRLQFGRQSMYYSHYWFVTGEHGAFDAAPNAVNSLNVLGTINGAYISGGFFNNTIRYEAPNLAGFSGMVSYSFDAESAANSRNKTWFLGPTYTNGPFRAAWSHMVRRAQGSFPVQTVGTLDQNADRYTLAYLDNGWRVALAVDRNKVTDTATGNTQQRWAYAIPVAYTFGVNTVSVTWGQAKSTKLNGTTQQDTGSKMLSASYQYALSKRTQLNLSVVELRNQRNGRYDLWNNSLSGGFQMAAADAGAKTRMFYAGIKHSF